MPYMYLLFSNIIYSQSALDSHNYCGVLCMGNSMLWTLYPETNILETNFLKKNLFYTVLNL